VKCWASAFVILYILFYINFSDIGVRLAEFFAPRRPLRPVRKERKVVGAQVREIMILNKSVYFVSLGRSLLTREIQLTYLAILLVNPSVNYVV